MQYYVLRTAEFNRAFAKLDHTIAMRFTILIEKLAYNPLHIGKPLGYTFFRELKVDIYRAYYLVYKDRVVVALVALSTKKKQPETIARIKSMIPAFKKYIDSITFK